MILIGEHVAFQQGISTVKAKVIGVELNQYILLLTFFQWDNNGEWTEQRRIYYRDKKFIEGLQQE